MRKILALTVAFLLLFGAFMLLPVHGESEIYDSVIRLHVLANSDSDGDQAQKLLVRDRVIEVTGTLLKGAETRDEAEVILRQNLGKLREAAEEVLRQNGCFDAVAVSLGQEDYPTRRYERLAFPAGEYLSLRVMIGEAEGANWWCVLFPPLCLSAATTKKEAEEAFLAAGLTEEQYRIITDSGNGKYRLRFKILEVAGKWFD